MFRFLLRTAAAVCACLATTGAVQAALVTYNFTGTFTNAFNDLTWSGGVFNNGDTLSGSFTYDTSVSDIDPDPTLGNYNNVVSISVSTLAYSAAFSSTGSQVGILDNYAGVDAFQMFSGTQSGAAVASYALLSSFFLFGDLSQTAFSSDALPAALPPLSAFDPFNRGGELRFASSGTLHDPVRHIADFEVTSLTQSVPAPGSFALIAFGLLGLALRRRREA